MYLVTPTFNTPIIVTLHINPTLSYNLNMFIIAQKFQSSNNKNSNN